eukprot:476813-Prymnesium_polylepis.1
MWLGFFVCNLEGYVSRRTNDEEGIEGSPRSHAASPRRAQGDALCKAAPGWKETAQIRPRRLVQSRPRI